MTDTPDRFQWAVPRAARDARPDDDDGGGGEAELELAPRQSVRLLAHMGAEWASAIRFVDERPSSLRDHIAYAREGRFTVQLDGPIRDAAMVWAYVFAIPISTLAYLVIWQTSRFSRCLTWLAIELAVATALNHLPAVQWLIPDAFDVATWWPLNLLG